MLDNEHFLLQKLYFQIISPQLAFDALKDLAEEMDEILLLSGAKLEEGSIRRAEIPWLGENARARKRLAGPVLLGTN